MSIDEKVLEMAHDAFHMSRKITQPVDPHKRYQSNDKDDPHAELIEFVYRTGKTLFGAAR
jgi:hypothetical protein